MTIRIRYVPLTVALAASAASAQTRQYLEHPHPFTQMQTHAPIDVPLAPVLDPNYKEKQPYTVESVTVRPAPPPGWLLTEVLKDQPLAANFREAVARDGLDQPLDAVQGFTAFIPIASGRNSSDPLSPVSFDGYSREELSRYVTKNRINIELMHGTGDVYKALDGSTIRINKIGDSVSVNGARVISSVKTPQGFIYYLKAPFAPSAEATSRTINPQG